MARRTRQRQTRRPDGEKHRPHPRLGATATVAAQPDPPLLGSGLSPRPPPHSPGCVLGARADAGSSDARPADLPTSQVELTSISEHELLPEAPVPARTSTPTLPRGQAGVAADTPLPAVSSPDDEEFDLVCLVFQSIYQRGAEISEEGRPELFRSVLGDVQRLCLRPTRDARRPLHLHPPSPTILVGNGPTRSAATLEVPGPSVLRTSAGVRRTPDKTENRKGSSWNEIVRQFAKEQRIPEVFMRASDINIVQLTEACCTKQTLEESHKMRDTLVERIAKDVADRPTIFHQLIRELVYHRRIQDVVTTNFDTILEYALDDRSCNRSRRGLHRVHILVKNPTQAPLNRAILWPGASPRAVLVHKMHGSIPLNTRPREAGARDTPEPITYSDKKHWGDTIVLSQRDYDAYMGELHTTFPGSLLSDALSCFLICCGKNFYTEDQTFLYALRKTQFERQSKGVTIEGERFGGVVFYTFTPSTSDLLNLSTTGMIALRIAGAEQICEYLKKLNPLLPPSSPHIFDDRRLSLVAKHASLRIMLQVTVALMVLFEARRIEGFPELFAAEVTAIMDHLLQRERTAAAAAQHGLDGYGSEDSEGWNSDATGVDRTRKGQRDRTAAVSTGFSRQSDRASCLRHAFRRRSVGGCEDAAGRAD